MIIEKYYDHVIMFSLVTQSRLHHVYVINTLVTHARVSAYVYTIHPRIYYSRTHICTPRAHYQRVCNTRVYTTNTLVSTYSPHPYLRLWYVCVYICQKLYSCTHTSVFQCLALLISQEFSVRPPSSMFWCYRAAIY
jgi:hypothetical protein